MPLFTQHPPSIADHVILCLKGKDAIGPLGAGTAVSSTGTKKKRRSINILRGIHSTTNLSCHRDRRGRFPHLPSVVVDRQANLGRASACRQRENMFSSDGSPKISRFPACKIPTTKKVANHSSTRNERRRGSMSRSQTFVTIQNMLPLHHANTFGQWCGAAPALQKRSVLLSRQKNKP